LATAFIDNRTSYVCNAVISSVLGSIDFISISELALIHRGPRVNKIVMKDEMMASVD
jgi:hypothetical protein